MLCDDKPILFLKTINVAGKDDDVCAFSASEGSVLHESVVSLVDKGDNSDNRNNGQPDGSVLLELY